MTEKNIIWKEIDGVKWCYDDKNNRCSAKYWGSEEEALERLQSLKNCSDCSNCSNRYKYRDKKDSENQDGLMIPKIENIHQKVLEAATATEDSLAMSDWHTCETTHCRAGWVTFLAGKEGADLEGRFGPALAGSMIYRASSEIKVGMNEFYKGNKEALESMQKAAEEEKLLNQ